MMIFYTGNPEIRQYERLARAARAEVVNMLLQRLARLPAILVRRHSVTARQGETRTA